MQGKKANLEKAYNDQANPIRSQIKSNQTIDLPLFSFYSCPF